MLSLRLWFAASLLCSCVSWARAQNCDPDNHVPDQNPGPGCEWLYWSAFLTDRDHITESLDELRKGDWEKLPFCACGWYPHTIPCPGCPPIVSTVTHTDTISWSVSSTHGVQHALALKLKLFAEIGYTGTLTTQQQEALSGSHVRSVSTQFSRQPIMCFDRFYRLVWNHHHRAGERRREWTFVWVKICDESIVIDDRAYTYCSEVIASGSVTWDSFPNYQWAPQQPPCGGVPITDPDPWDGQRETPCCPDVCNPPSPPQTPCCGCEAIP